MLLRTERIADTELGLLYRDRLFRRLLEPGVHKIARLPGKAEVVRLDLTQAPVRTAALADLYLTHRDLVETHFAVADMAEAES